MLEFVKKLYKEEEIEETPDFSDFDILEYKLVLGGIVEIWDYYIPIDDILTATANNFTAKSVIQYYNYTLDLWMQDIKPEFNYYNFTKYNLNPKQYKQEEKENLEKSKKAVKEAKKNLETLLNNK